MRRTAIEEQDQLMLSRQHEFRMAADLVTDAFMGIEEVEAVAVIGSVARPLWKVPRREFRRAGVDCGMNAGSWILPCGSHRWSGLRICAGYAISRCAMPMPPEPARA